MKENADSDFYLLRPPPPHLLPDTSLTLPEQQTPHTPSLDNPCTPEIVNIIMNMEVGDDIHIRENMMSSDIFVLSERYSIRAA